MENPKIAHLFNDLACESQLQEKYYPFATSLVGHWDAACLGGLSPTIRLWEVLMMWYRGSFKDCSFCLVQEKVYNELVGLNLYELACKYMHDRNSNMYGLVNKLGDLSLLE